MKQALVLLICFISITITKGQNFNTKPIYIPDSITRIGVDTAFHPAHYNPAVYKPDNAIGLEPGNHEAVPHDANKLFPDNKTFDKMLEACNDSDYESALHHIDKMSGKEMPAEQVSVLNDWRLFCLRKLNRYDEIISVFSADNVNLYYPANYAWVGYAFWYKERYNDAIKYYDKAGIRTSANVDKAFLYTAGISSFDLSNYDRAIECFYKYISVGGDDTSAYYYSGAAGFFLGKYEKAVENLGKYIQKGGDHESAFYYSGIAYFNMAKYEKSISSFNIYVQIGGRDAEALYYSGLANYNSGKYDSAVSSLNRYISKGGKNQSALLYLGYSSFLQFYANKGYPGKIDDAIKYYTRYIAFLDATKSTKRAGVYINRAQAKMYKDDFAGAIADYDLQIKYTPNDLLAYELKANCYERMKNISGAIDAAEAAMKLFPNNATLYTMRAWYRALNVSYSSALQDADKAISLNNKSGAAYSAKGYILMKQNKNSDALTCFNKAIESDTSPTANSYYYRGIVKQQMNDIPGACSDWNKALEIKFFMDPLLTNADVEKMKGAYCR